jgi:hypothetical protein
MKSIRYQPKPATHFNPDNIIITKGSFQTKQRRELVKEICGVYPQATVIEKFDLPLRHSDEDDNT